MKQFNHHFHLVSSLIFSNMRSYLSFFTAFTPLGTLAAPYAETIQNFRVIYANQQVTENVPAKTTMKVLKSDLSGLLGGSSSNIIAEGNFAKIPLSFHVNSQGAGNITHGNSTY
jgi:hypothetical protein